MGGQAAQLRPIKARGKTGRARPAEAVQRTIRRMRRDLSLASQRPRASVAFHAMALLPTPSTVDGSGKISLQSDFMSTTMPLFIAAASRLGTGDRRRIPAPHLGDARQPTLLRLSTAAFAGRRPN